MLCEFENKYSFLYEIMVNGIPVYTCLRDGVQARLADSGKKETMRVPIEKGRVYPKRIYDGIKKQIRFAKKKTLIFTSAMYRRDKGRNLAVEYLMERYPDAVVFEWPSRNDAFDAAYFCDGKKDRYCPLDHYVVFYKLYVMLHRREKKRLTAECRKKLEQRFLAAASPADEREAATIRYIMDILPDYYAQITISQSIFRKLFAKYFVDYAIDFWGAARENIFPVLPGEPQTIELQHGLINSDHAGYIYPSFVKAINSTFFKRSLLVYGEATKKLLGEASIFSPWQIEVIGNPRIKMYKKLFAGGMSERDLVLFTSQPYEQDGKGRRYYDTVIPMLKEFARVMAEDPRWTGRRLAVKLHPRENGGVKEIYQRELPGIEVFGPASQLFELLSRSFVQLTVTSTSLYEAAEFGTPTVALAYDAIDHREVYGFDVWRIDDVTEVAGMLDRCLDRKKREEYLDYLKTMV